MSSLKRALLAIALWLCVSSAFGQTIGYSEWKIGTSGTATATTTGGTTQATGSTFVVFAAYRNTSGGAAAPTSISDSKGNTYTLAKTMVYAFSFAEDAIYYCINCTGGASHTVTATWAASTTDLLSVAFIEIKSVGAATATTAPAGTKDDSATGSITAPSITTGVANEIVVEAFTTYGANAGAISTSGTGFTQIVAQTTGSGMNGAVAWAVPASSGTAEAAAFNHSAGGGDYAGALSISFQPGGGGGGCTHNFWKSTGAFAQPDGSTGSYWNLATGAFSTPNCSTGTFWRQDGASAAN